VSGQPAQPGPTRAHGRPAARPTHRCLLRGGRCATGRRGRCSSFLRCRSAFRDTRLEAAVAITWRCRVARQSGEMEGVAGPTPAVETRGRGHGCGPVEKRRRRSGGCAGGGEKGEHRRPPPPAVGKEENPGGRAGCGLCRALRATTQGQGRSGGGVGQGRRRRGIDKVRDRGGSGRWRKGAAERGHGVGGGGWQRILGEGSRGRKAGCWLVDLGFFLLLLYEVEG
jgi:hypothetical protein